MKTVLSRPVAVLSALALVASRHGIEAFPRSVCPPRGRPAAATKLSSSAGSDDDAFRRVATALARELGELADCSSVLVSYLSKPDREVTAQDVLLACDAAEETADLGEDEPFVNRYLALRRHCHRFGRYQLLVKLLKSDHDAYVKTAEFLSPNRIPRSELPNVQEVSYIAPNTNEDRPIRQEQTDTNKVTVEKDGIPLVPDCELETVSYNDSLLDKILLSIFRNLVTQHTGGIQSDIRGIKGLLAQGREYMTMELPEGVTYRDHTIAQHTMVKNTLGGLMTPALPPFYRIFMSGIVPDLNTDWDGKQIGPWFYAPWLTSIVTPPFFRFLVGPSKPNRRRDGERGGLLVEKCKFLQESGCKGLCLHQCKIPAQEFFRDTLGMDLTVRPNFVTQECQWSFGEKPMPPEEDPSFPRGCLVGCESRKLMAGRKAEGLCL